MGRRVERPRAPVTELQSKRLDGWKAIASHVGRNERTVMRWRRERGMPVYQVPGRHGSVCAFVHEIDAWLDHESAADALRPPSGALPAMPPPSQHGADAPGGAFAALSRRRPRFRWAWAAVVAAVLMAMLTAWVSWVRESRRVPGVPVGAELRGNELIAWDAFGRRLWTRAMPHDVKRDAGPERFRPCFGRQVRLADLDGDGLPEILVAAAYESVTTAEFRNEALYCLSHDGRPLWRYEPRAVLTFAGRRFAPPWRIDGMAIAEGRTGNPGRVYVAFAHCVWWPSFVVRVGTDGKATTTYVQSGAIHSLRRWRDADGRKLLLAGGINNEFAAASLAVLAEDGPPSASPQTAGSGYVCDDCPADRPLHYFVFPRPELAVLAGGPYNAIFGIAFAGNNVIALASEVWTHGPLADVAWSGYEFSDHGSVPVRAWALDGYWAHHRALEVEGRLKHTSAACPERGRARRLVAWRPDGGWSESSVPWIEPSDPVRRAAYADAGVYPNRRR